MHLLPEGDVTVRVEGESDSSVTFNRIEYRAGPMVVVTDVNGREHECLLGPIPDAEPSPAS